MKLQVKRVKQFLAVSSLVLSAAGLLGVLLPATAFSENSAADEIVSLNATDQPLGEVLENLSMAANCQFSIDESWEDYPVTASFDDEPLYRGLKLILRDINNAVIYGADRTIKIIIYDEGEPSAETAGRTIANKSPQDFIQPPSISGDATAPQSEVADSDEGSDTQDGEQQLEAIAESKTEMQEADAEDTDSRVSETGDGSSEDNDADSEAEGKESGPLEEKRQSEETESSPDESEN